MPPKAKKRKVEEPVAPTRKPNIYGYARVSSLLQGDGASIETQTQQIQNYCKLKGWDEPRMFCDISFSAKDMDSRPKLREMVELSQDGDRIVVAELSRIMRNVTDWRRLCKELCDKKVGFVCLSPDIDVTTLQGELMLTIMMAIHEFERKHISKKVKENMVRLAMEKKLRTKPMFGYECISKTKDYEPVPEQQEVIKLIKKWHKEGNHKENEGFCEIARRLNQEGHNKVLRPKRVVMVEDGVKKKVLDDKPRKFHAQQVKNILEQYRRRKAFLEENPQRWKTIHGDQ